MTMNNEPEQKPDLESSHLQILLQISSTLNSSLNLQEVLHASMEQVVKLLKAERGFIMLSEQGELVLKISKNFSEEDIIKGQEISHGVIDQVFTSGESVLTVNAMDDQRFSTRDSVVVYQLRSVLCVPLRIKGKPIGVIYLDNRWKSGIFSKRDQETLTTFANHAAIALENARLYHNLKTSIDDKLQLQEEIYRGKMMAEVERETSRLREELAHHLVHDIRNPLTVIFSAFGVLETMVPSSILSEQDELIRKARSNFKVVSNMLNDILDVYRLENCEFETSVQKIDLASIANDILQNAEYFNDNKSVRFSLEIADRPLMILTDQGLMIRILNNLVQNSCVWTEKGYIKIRGLKDESRNAVYIDVVDTGPGIPEEHRSTIFSKFVRLGQKSKSRFSKGMGLAFCKLALKALNGDIQALENPEGGSIMRISLPLNLAEMMENSE